MEKLKTGGKTNTALGSNALLDRRRDISLRLQQARRSSTASKNISTKLSSGGQQLFVMIKSAAVTERNSRMLTETEIENLKRSKKIMAKRALEIIRGVHGVDAQSKAGSVSTQTSSGIQGVSTFGVAGKVIK